MSYDELKDWLYRIRSEIITFMPKIWHKKMIETIDEAIAAINRQQKYCDYESTIKNDLGVDCNNCKNNLHRGDGTSYCATSDGMCHFECEETPENDLGVDCVSRQAVLNKILKFSVTEGRSVSVTGLWAEINGLPSATPKEPKIKVLERDEAIRKLGAVDVYEARAWITLLDDLEYLKLKICEVEE